MNKLPKYMLATLALAGCLLCNALKLSASVPEPVEDARAAQLQKLRALSEAPGATAYSDYTVAREPGETEAAYFERALEFRTQVYAALRGGKPLPKGALAPALADAANWRLHLEESGLDPDTATEADIDALRERTARQATQARDIRWAVLQQPGALYRDVEIVRVVDGDTLDVRIDLERDGYAEVERLRLYGIDIAERSEPGGDAATALLSDFVNTGPIAIWVPTRETSRGPEPRRGKYGRLLAVLYAGTPDVANWGTQADALYQLACINEDLVRRYGK
jgi:endonuclease YncB( thermonuclease family)